MDRLPTDSNETRALLAQVQAGDSEALDRVLALHRPSLRQMVELRLDRKLRQRVDPSDVVQEAHLEASRRIGDYLAEPAIAFRLWLRRIAYDRLVMIRRRHLDAERRAMGRELPLPDRSTAQLARALLADISTPSQRLIRGEMGHRIRVAVSKLSEPDREIILMRNFEGLSNQDAAQLLDLTPSAANKRYGRALLRLRTLLLEGGLTESAP